MDHGLWPQTIIFPENSLPNSLNFRIFIFMAKIKKPKHVAIAGNIGAGKTTLTEMLSKHYRWIPQFEDVDHNPYLMDFYEDMPRWSFNLQIFSPWY